MSRRTDALFPYDEVSPGQHRLVQLAEAAGEDPDDLEPSTRHALMRALQCGFRPSCDRLVDGLDLAPAWRASLDEMPDSWWFVRGDFEVVTTGFGPFESHETNPSKPFAKAVAAGLSGSIASSYEGLDVTYREIEEFVRLYDYESQPLLIHCGLAEGRGSISLERYAHNVCGDRPDNSGRDVSNPWVVSGGPTALETLLPLDSMAGQFSEALSTEGDLRVETTRDAGEFVCNALYYRSLLAVRQVRTEDFAAEAIFVHVPELDVDAARRYGREFGRKLAGFLETAVGN